MDSSAWKRRCHYLAAGSVLALMAACSHTPRHTTATGHQAPPAGSAWGSGLPPVFNAKALEMQAARRIMEVNSGRVYHGQTPEVLLAIPVIEVELNGDGSVRHMQVLRYPKQAQDTVPIAMDAIRKGAPYGNVSRMPKPWKFTQTFLFDDDRKFKLRALD